MNISVVIPAYNEAENIGVTIKQTLSVLNGMPEIEKIQIIVVDDHSSDNTFDRTACLNDPRIIILRLSRRSGSLIAIRAGIKKAVGDAILFISADGQDDPACLANMLEKWRQGAKIIWALRKDRKNEPWYIRQPAQIFYKVLFWISDKRSNQIDLSRLCFFLLDRIVVDAINNCPEQQTALMGLIAWLGFRQDFVEYERPARLSGSSKWNFRRKFQYAKDWIITFSELPLKIPLLIGITILISGLLGLLLGWTPILVSILILSGIQLIVLGIIGEYLLYTLHEARKRPLYFIEQTWESNE